MGALGIIVSVVVGYVISYILLGYWKKNLEEKLEAEKEQKAKLNPTARDIRQENRRIRRAAKLQPISKKSLAQEGKTYIDEIFGIPKTGASYGAGEALSDLFNLKSLIAEFATIEISSNTLDVKIGQARTLAAKKIKIKKELDLQVICYGFAIAEYWEMIEGIKLAFKDAGKDFKVPETAEEKDALLTQMFNESK